MAADKATCEHEYLPKDTKVIGDDRLGPKLQTEVAKCHKCGHREQTTVRVS